MTSKIVRPPRKSAFARAGLTLTAVGGLVAIGSFFAAMIPIELGIAPALEIMIVAMHAGSAIATLGLLVVCLARARLAVPALRHPVVLAPLAVAVWSAALAPFQEFPLNALLGSPLMGEGALMYGEIAAITAAAMILRRFRIGLLVAAGGAAVGAVIPALMAAGWSRPDFFPEYTCFFALTSAVLVIAAGRWLPAWPAVALGLAAGLPALLLSDNRSVWIAAGFGLLAAAFFAWWERRGSTRVLIDRHRAGAFLIPITAALATAGTAIVGYEGWVRSLTSRLYLDRIAIEALQDRPLSLLIGQGWGRTSDTIVAHFNASRAVLWDGSWDATLRGFTHLHNFASEAVLAAGLPAVFGLVAMIAFVPLFARRTLLPLAVGFSVAFVTLWSVWFQIAMTVPAAALAAGWLVRPAKPWRTLRSPNVVNAAAVAFLTLITAASTAAAIWLTVIGLEIRRSYFAEKPGDIACETMPLDLDRGSYTLAIGFDVARNAVFDAERTGAEPSTAAVARLDRLLCAVGRAAATSRSAELLILPVLFRADITFDPGLTLSRVRYADTLAGWERALVRFLARAPHRTDMAWFYLSWRFRMGDYANVLAFSRQLLERNPRDPVGLWFEGLVFAKASQAGDRARGFDLLRQSLAAGIERFVPIDPALKAEISQENSRLGTKIGG